jgi:ribonuclease I
VAKAVLVPLDRKVPDRGDSEELADLTERMKPMRTAGPLFSTSWQLFACNGDEQSEELAVDVPEEIMLAQLIVHYVHPHCERGFDARSTFHWKRGIRPPNRLLPEFKFEVVTSMMARGKSGSATDPR